LSHFSQKWACGRTGFPQWGQNRGAVDKFLSTSGTVATGGFSFELFLRGFFFRKSRFMKENILTTVSPLPHLKCELKLLLVKKIT